MANLYVNEPGTKIGYADNYFTVSSKDGMLRKIPSETLESISLFGPVQISAQCIKKCLMKGVGISYYSKGGSYFGRIASTNHVNTFRQRQQVKMTSDEEFMLDFSKKIIKAKLNNQVVVLRRYLNSAGIEDKKEVENILAIYKKIDFCDSREQLIGYEGIAARAYFAGLAKAVDKSFKFNGRNRRPPKDPFNSMLSLGYSILLNEIYGEIEAKGMNPYFGFLHQDREKHPTLASDLMEEWRAVIVDSTVMSLINGHEIKCENFFTLPDKPGVFLDKEGMRTFINKLERKFLTKAKYLSYNDYSVSFRSAIGMQMNCLVRTIENEDISAYMPIKIR